MCGIWAYISHNQIENFTALFDAFNKIRNRGPEVSRFNILNAQNILGFHRLGIMDPSLNGDQPFSYLRSDGSSVYLICNGEIYNYKDLISLYNLSPKSNSDCEVILEMYIKFGIDKTVRELQGEFAFIIFDVKKDKEITVHAARDAIGVRPLFYCENEEFTSFSSELKGLATISRSIKVFPPGRVFTLNNNKSNLTTFYDYVYPKLDLGNPETKDIYAGIRNALMNAVSRRLMTDRPFGALLSGGLDSSLVCAIAHHLQPEIQFPVFTIAIDKNSPDLFYSKKVASYLNLKNHHIIEVTADQALTYIDKTIYAIESWDITTVRASIMQYIIGDYISKKTDVKVLLCGELSDEIHLSYLYGHFAPNATEAKKEAIRLVKDVHMFDGLRTDRTMASHGLEVRLPFSDLEYVDYFFSLPDEYFLSKNGVEKFYLRDAFKETGLLSEDVLFRKKEALSDGISNKERSWFEIIGEYIDTIISDEEFSPFRYLFPSKEAYYYKKKFSEYFSDSENISNVIPYYWLPKWCGDVKNPSARVLTNY